MLPSAALVHKEACPLQCSLRVQTSAFAAGKHFCPCLLLTVFWVPQKEMGHCDPVEPFLFRTFLGVSVADPMPSSLVFNSLNSQALFCASCFLSLLRPGPSGNGA